MNSPNAIQDELNELSSILPFENKQPVFTVPASYFENFSAAVWAKIKSQQPNAAEELKTLSPVLAAIPKKIPFSVPENYFQTIDLPAFTEPVTPLLAEISRRMPYEVPAGYFETLGRNLNHRMRKPLTPVVSINTRIARYAAAAVVAGLVVMGSFFYFKGNNALDPTRHSEAWVAQKLEKVSNSELETFINTADVNPNGGDLAGQSSREVRNLLSDVSTSELEAFLNEVPTANEELSVIN